MGRAKVSLAKQIAALPEWPHIFEYNCDDLDAITAQRDAALAHLALARDLLVMVREAAINRRGENFNLTREQWAMFHAGLAALERQP